MGAAIISCCVIIPDVPKLHAQCLFIQVWKSEFSSTQEEAGTEGAVAPLQGDRAWILVLMLHYTNQSVLTREFHFGNPSLLEILSTVILFQTSNVVVMLFKCVSFKKIPSKVKMDMCMYLYNITYTCM